MKAAMPVIHKIEHTSVVGLVILEIQYVWPFSKRGSRVDEVPTQSLPMTLPADLSVFGTNDAVIKLWLPEKLTLSLDRLSSTQSMSRPDVLRWLLFEHVYGRPALEQLKAWKRQRDAEAAEARRVAADRVVDSDAQFSPARSFVAERTITAQLLGKSVEDFKLWLPSPLKVQLDTLAKMESLGISDYLRKTLVRILLGEVFHHQWRQAVGKLPEEVRLFESSQEI
jgi:hypothetical protein